MRTVNFMIIEILFPEVDLINDLFKITSIVTKLAFLWQSLKKETLKLVKKRQKNDMELLPLKLLFTQKASYSTNR